MSASLIAEQNRLATVKTGTFTTTTPTSNPTITNHGFTGHRHNNTGANDLGLIYMNARYYLPEVGRFISADTIVPEPANPQSFNRYSYGYNNPVKYVDQDGHCPQPSGEWADVSFVCVAGFIPVVQSPTAKKYPELSTDLQSQVDLYNTYAAIADVIALGMSLAGATTEIGVAAVDTISPIGDLAGVALYYRFINPVEDTASLISFIATFTGDVAESANYFQLDPLELGIGQDTIVSGGGIILGNVLPLEGILDTLINIPLAWYSVKGAAGEIITYLEFRWTEELGWHFIAYPPPSESQGLSDD